MQFFVQLEVARGGPVIKQRIARGSKLKETAVTLRGVGITGVADQSVFCNF